MKVLTDRMKYKLAITNRGVREFLAELLGTFVVVSFGVGAGCQYTLSGDSSSPTTAHLAGAMGVMLGISVAGGVSGGGVNPAVSLAFCLSKRTPWYLYPVHVIGQVIGAFLASATIYAVYADAIYVYGEGQKEVEGSHATAAMFFSMPHPLLSTEIGFLDQVVGTGLLILGVHAIIDDRNMNSHKGLKPLLVGLIVLAIGGSLGMNCGYPINPARDLGPRLFLMVAGWGTEVFSYREYNWFWVPIVGPLVGSAVATFIYYFFIAWHWPQQNKDTQKSFAISRCEHNNENGMHGHTNTAFNDTVLLSHTKF